jgi:predicted RNA-binding protein (virulence factor B family)
VIALGKYHELPVTRTVNAGITLGEGDDQVFMPARSVPEGTALGDVLRVFVYSDSDDRPTATTRQPYAIAGQYAYLECVDTSHHGAFMDWGLDKDLFVPWSEQYNEMRVGQKYVVMISVDELTNRVMARSMLRDTFDADTRGFELDQEVSLLVYNFNEFGTQVVVDGRYSGLVYHNETFSRLAEGQELRGYVKEIREDGRLDVRLQRTGRAGTSDAQAVVLAAMEEAGGFLPIHDKSPPQYIKRHLAMSKKAFKRAIGALYKQRRIVITERGIELIKE